MSEFLNYEQCKQITKDGYVPENKIGTVMSSDGNIVENTYLFTEDDVWAVTQEDWDKFYENEHADTFKEEPNDNEEYVESPLEKAERESKENYNKYLMALADTQNIRKRTATQISNLTKYQDENLAKDILPVIDNFERALEAFVVKDEVNTANKRGIEMIFSQLVTALEKHDIKVIAINEGDAFDDSKMNATGITALPNFDNNAVVTVMQNGYMYKDKVIRFANVLVNKVEE